MNYHSAAEDIGCETISDIQINIGPQYTINMQEPPAEQNSKRFVSGLLRLIEEMGQPLKFDDKVNKDQYIASIAEITDRIVANRKNSGKESFIGSIGVDLVPLTFRERLWKHLITKFDFLRADNKGNFDRVQEFITSLIENLCTHYQESYLKEDGLDENGMEFPKYLNNTLQAFSAFSCSSLYTNQGYFQKRYYILKEKLAMQEKELTSLLKLEGQPTFEQICKGLEYQYSAVGSALSNIVKEIDMIKGFDDNGKIKERLTFIQQSLSLINEDFNCRDTPLRNLHKRKKVDGYFLPFHRIKTRPGFNNTKYESRRSISMQTSKQLYSEHMSYDSFSRQNTSSNGMKESTMRLSGGIRGLIRNMSDKSYDKRGMIEDPKNNACSVQETSPEDLVELEKLRNIIGLFGISKNEVLEDGDELKSKINHFLGLEDKFNLLNLKYLKLADEFNELKIDSLENKVTRSSPQKEIVEHLQRQLNDAENEKKILYNDLIDEKKISDHLSHQCDQNQEKIKKLTEAIDRKEFIIQNQAKRYQDLLTVVETEISPKINKYRANYNELVDYLTDGYIKNLMNSYRELNERKVDMCYQRIDFLQEQYEQFATAIELTAKNTTKEMRDKFNISGKIQKIKHIVSLFTSANHKELLNDVNNRIDNLNLKVKAQLDNLKKQITSSNEDKIALQTAIDEMKQRLDNSVNDYETTNKELELQYKDYVNKLTTELEDKKEEIIEKENTIQQMITDQQENSKPHLCSIEELKNQLSSKIKELENSNIIIEDLKQKIQNINNDKFINNSNARSTESPDMQLMNTKIVGELEIITRKCDSLKAENAELLKKLHEQEDMEEKVNELMINNKILENKLERFESYKNINDKYDHQRKEQGVFEDNRDYNTETIKEFESEKPSNKTIQEVEEKLERSDIDYSVDTNKIRHKGSLPVTEKETGFYSYNKKDNGRISHIFTCINHNYDYIHEKREAPVDFSSPQESSIKKNIFSKDSIMKNIEAFRYSNQSIKQENPDKKELVPIYATPKSKLHNPKTIRLTNSVNKFIDRVNNIVNIDKLTVLEEKLKKLEFLLLENDIQSLSRPKRDSNLQALTEQSIISRDQSAILDQSRSESKKSTNIVSSMLQKKQSGHDKVEKPKDESRKLFSKQGEKKPNVKLDKLHKAYGHTSQSKKSQNRFSKDALFKQPKLFSKSIKSSKKEQKSVEIDFEQTNKATELALKRLEEDMRTERDALKIENVNLVNQMESITQQNNEYKQLLNMVFEKASALVHDQMASGVLMKVEYIDQIMNMVQTKIENYESTINELEDEIEMIKQEMYNYQQFSARDENGGEEDEEVEAEDIGDNQPEDENLDTENDDNERVTQPLHTNFSAEKQQQVKKAFEDLLTNMFAITDANIGFIENLEEQVIPDCNENFSETQRAEVVHLALELDKLKSNTTNLKEMIECLYENLMEFMDENEEVKFGETQGKSGSPIANLKAENEYLHQELINITKNYEELMNKCHDSHEEGNSSLKKLRSTPDLKLDSPNDNRNPIKDHIRHFLQKNIDYIENPSDIKEENQNIEDMQGEALENLDYQMEHLNFVISRINQIIRSNTADNYKIMKIEELLSNPEAA